MSRKAQTPQTPEQATATQETQTPETQAPETATPEGQTTTGQAEAREETPVPAGTRAAAQRSEAFAAPNASDPECRAGSATEGYPEDIAVLAVRHRVASWEQAALARMMGWADGKMVTDAAYQAALAKLHGRRLGGGRMA